MREKTKIRFFWDNPITGTGMLEKTTGDRVYQRKINKNSLLSPVEAAKVLSVSLVHVHRLIKNNRLKATRKGEGMVIKMSDIVRFDLRKRSAGRPRKGEPFLIN
jgi:excisionase family DNA binding protein